VGFGCFGMETINCLNQDFQDLKNLQDEEKLLSKIMFYNRTLQMIGKVRRRVLDPPLQSAKSLNPFNLRFRLHPGAKLDNGIFGKIGNIEGPICTNRNSSWILHFSRAKRPYEITIIVIS
jgi:hypothetical protein